MANKTESIWKKALPALGIVFLAIIALFACGVVWFAYQMITNNNSPLIKEFYSGYNSGNVSAISPELYEKTMPHDLMVKFFQITKKHLGNNTGFKVIGISKGTQYYLDSEYNGEYTNLKVDATYEKGSTTETFGIIKINGKDVIAGWHYTANQADDAPGLLRDLADLAGNMSMNDSGS